jgi:hypothetical protein
VVEAGYEAAGDEDGDDIGGRAEREEQWEKQRERRRERKRLGCDAVMVRFMSRSAVSLALMDGERDGQDAFKCAGCDKRF